MSNSGFFLFDQITYSFLEDGRRSTVLQYVIIEEVFFMLVLLRRTSFLDT